MAFKAAGNPISVLREHLLVNTSSFTGTSGYADFFPELARIDGMPARAAHLHDSTDYAANPIEDSWEQRLAGGTNTPAHQNLTGLRGGQQT
jgi:hypothetical protein